MLVLKYSFKYFQRKIDDEVYWVSEPVEENTVASDNSAVKAEPTPVADSEDEVNSTSMVNCKTERQAGSLSVEVLYIQI